MVPGKNCVQIFFQVAYKPSLYELSGKLNYVKQCFNASLYKGCLASWKYIACWKHTPAAGWVVTLTMVSSSTFYDESEEGFHISLGNEMSSIYGTAHKPWVLVKIRNLTKWEMKIWIFNVRTEPHSWKSMEIKICFSLRHSDEMRFWR